MKSFAIIENNKIINIILADDNFIQQHYENKAIDITNISPKPHIGYDVINGIIQFPIVASFEDKVNSSNLSSDKKSNLLIKYTNQGIFTEDELLDIQQIYQQ